MALVNERQAAAKPTQVDPKTGKPLGPARAQSPSLDVDQVLDQLVGGLKALLEEGNDDSVELLLQHGVAADFLNGHRAMALVNERQAAAKPTQVDPKTGKPLGLLLVASPVVSSEGLWARAGPRGLPVLGSTCVGLRTRRRWPSWRLLPQLSRLQLACLSAKPPRLRLSVSEPALCA
jgi:hypothetical protein